MNVAVGTAGVVWPDAQSGRNRRSRRGHGGNEASRGCREASRNGSLNIQHVAARNPAEPRRSSMNIRALAFLCALALSIPFQLSGAAAKTLRVNVTGDPGMIDPITYSELVAGRVLDNVYE